jgi:hypothetical protein
LNIHDHPLDLSLTLTVSLVGLGIEKGLEFLRSRELDLAKPSCWLAHLIGRKEEEEEDIPSLWGFLFNKEGWSARVSLIASMIPDTGA